MDLFFSWFGELWDMKWLRRFLSSVIEVAFDRNPNPQWISIPISALGACCGNVGLPEFISIVLVRGSACALGDGAFPQPEQAVVFIGAVQGDGFPFPIYVYVCFHQCCICCL